MNTPWKRIVLAMASGAMLAFSDWPICFTWLHFIAFIPLFVAYMTSTEPKIDWRTGLIFVCTYGGVLAFSAATVLPVWIVVVWSLFQWTLSLAVVGRVLRWHWLLGPLSAAAILTLVELFVWHVVPIFGMAQCFARVTSAVPTVVQFAAYTGLAVVVFALIFSQALIAGIIAGRFKSDRNQLRRLSVLAVFLLLLGVVNYHRWHRPLGISVPVAVFGWAGTHSLSLPMMCQAAREAEAQILVTPELGFWVDRESPEEGLQALARDVRHAGLHAAIGVARTDLGENQALMIDAEELRTYTKSHLILFMESGPSGQGRLTSVEWCGVRCGVMICQDDNFSDLSRAYGRDGTQLMLVPTLDWNPICGLHYESSVMRAIENGYAIGRSASGGISALISPRGEVIASHNHNQNQDARCIAGSLPVGDGLPTWYARLGDWPMGLFSLAVLALGACWIGLQQRSTKP